MNRRRLLLIFTALLPMLVLAQGWPANYGGVMLQGFFWDSYNEKPDCSPWGPPNNRQTNSATESHQAGYTWATMYGAGWGSAEEWQVPVTTWNSLLAHKNEIAPYIDLLWLPQSGSTVAGPTSTYYYNASQDYSGRGGKRPWRGGDTWNYTDGMTITNPDCMGFVPVFYFHHGMTYNSDNTPWTYDFWKDGSCTTFTPMSYFGTEPELRQLISEYKAAGTGCIEDVVANHRGGLGTWNGDANSIDFPSEMYRDELIEWSSADVCSNDESRRGTGNADCGGEGQWARDIDHHSAATRAKVMKYLDYLQNDLGYVGFRWDYAMGFEEKHFAEYNTALRPTFSVGEYWGSQENIEGWIKKTYAEDNYQSAAFDFPLMYAINDAFNNGNYRGLDGKGMITHARMKRYAVTFVDNHDTFKDLPTDDSNSNYSNRTNNHIVEANAFILSMPGTPCLFYPHFMHPSWHNDIVTLIKARRTAGITNEAALWSMEEWGTDGARWKVTGNNGELVYECGTNVANEPVPTGFTAVWTGDVARVSINDYLYDQVAGNTKENLVDGYPVISLNSGCYDMSGAGLEVTIRPSNENCTLVYTTDGHTPVAASYRVGAEGKTFHFTKTTTLRVGVLVGEDKVESIVDREYVADINTSNQITVHVKCDDAPNLYMWYTDANSTEQYPNGAWPGSQTDGTKVVGGVTWHTKSFPKPAAGTSYNLIVNWSGNSQTTDLTGITSDIFLNMYDGTAQNVTAAYITASRSPRVSIDKPSGDYVGSVTADMIATNEDAVIVYTTDGSAPTASNGTRVTYSGNVTFNYDTSNSQTTQTYTLRAGTLVGNEVINQVARVFAITENTLDNNEWENDVVNDSGYNIYVHTDANNTAPNLYVWDPDRYTIGDSEITHSYKPNGAFPGSPMTNLKLVKLNATGAERTYYYYHVDSENLASGKLGIIFSHNNNQTGDIVLTAPGSYFYDYGLNTSYTELTTSTPYVSTTQNGFTATTATTTGINIYVRRTDGGEPFMNYWDASLGGTPLDPSYAQVTPFVPTTIKKVDNKNWNYLHLDADAVTLQFTKDAKWGKTNGSGDAAVQTSNISIGAAGIYFYEYDGTTGYTDVSSSYLSSVTWENVAVDNTGYNIYVKATNGAPKIHAWDSNDSALTGDYPGTTMSEVRKVKANGSSTETEYYYYHFNAGTDLSGFLVNYNGDTDKSNDFAVTGTGNYFVQYSGSNGALTDQTSTYVTSTTSSSWGSYAAPTATGTNLYIRSNGSSVPSLYTWDGDSRSLSPLTEKRKVKANGSSTETEYYYYHTSSTSFKYIIANSNTGWDNQTKDETISAGGNYFLLFNESGTKSNHDPTDESGKYVTNYSAYATNYPSPSSSASNKYLRGTVNSWGASSEWEFLNRGNGVYVLYDKTLSGEFKVADASWSNDCNYGSNGSSIRDNTSYNLSSGGGNIACAGTYTCRYVILTLSGSTHTLYLQTSTPTVNFTEAIQTSTTTVSNNFTQTKPVTSATSISEQTYVLTKSNLFTLKTYVANTIYKIYVHVIQNGELLDGNAHAPYLYTFNPEVMGAFPGTRITGQQYSNGSTWYYTELAASSTPTIIFNNGYSGSANQTSDISSLVAGENYFNFFLDQTEDGGSNRKYENLTTQYASYFEIPSCCTYLPGKQFIYFEDSSYGNPYVWIWNGTRIFTGSCWPGEMLVDVVGTADNGNTIYRWTWDTPADPNAVLPANVIFNDNGNPQTADWTFVNGGYYTLDGYKGRVTGSALSLADLLAHGDLNKEYYISDDVAVIHVNEEGTKVFIKDAAGNANNPSDRTAGQQDYIGEGMYQTHDYSQSNWAVVTMLQDNTRKTNFEGKTIVGNTLRATLLDRDEQSIEVTIDPVIGDAVTYEKNVFIPASFVYNEDYYFMQPQQQEVMQVTWAICSNVSGSNYTFVLPAKNANGSVNGLDLDGAFIAKKGDLWAGGDAPQVGYEYTLTGVAHKLASGGGSGAPRRAAIEPKVDGNPVSDTYEVLLIDATKTSEQIYTDIADIAADVHRTVKDVRYVDMMGRQSDKPFNGVNIVVTRYTDGTVSTTKVLK